MPEEKKPFINEKIVKKSGAGKSFRRIVRMVVSAILFGVIAAVTAVLVFPFAQKYIGKQEETTTQEMVVIPRDDPEVSEESKEPAAATKTTTSGTEGTAAVEKTGETPAESANADETKVSEAKGNKTADDGTEDSKAAETGTTEKGRADRETAGSGKAGNETAGSGRAGSESAGSGKTDSGKTNGDAQNIDGQLTGEKEDGSISAKPPVESKPYTYSMEDVNNLWKNISVLCNQLDASVVTVCPVQNELDLFDNPVSLEGKFSGVVIAETGLEYKILTVAEAVKGDSVRILWHNGFEQKATVAKTDEENGLAVISVRKFELNDATRAMAKVIPLGNSNRVQRGDLLVKIGSPDGIPHSTGYSWVSYIAKNVTVRDGFTRILFTDEAGDAKSGTWVTNADGELIGWEAQFEKTETFDSKGNAGIYCISDYKGILEKMVNGKDIPYVGIKAVELTEEMQKKMPGGIYVTDVVPNGPAYEAGIQPGDIISKIDKIDMKGLSAYRNAIETLVPGLAAAFVVQRESREEEYKELTYQVTPGKR